MAMLTPSAPAAPGSSPSRPAPTRAPPPGPQPTNVGAQPANVGSPPTGLLRPQGSRTSFLSKLTTFQNRTMSVVPYAPERLSISQTVMTPAVTEAIIQAVGIETLSRRSHCDNGGAKYCACVHFPREQGIQAEKRASNATALEEAERLHQHQPNTLFAALRMRRALRRTRSGPRVESEEKISEAQANMDRHKKVLSRYKIRRVDFVDPNAMRMKIMGWFMVNPHSTLFKVWQLVR